jgi:hypothetical protein
MRIDFEGIHTLIEPPRQREFSLALGTGDDTIKKRLESTRSEKGILVMSKRTEEGDVSKSYYPWATLAAQFHLRILTFQSIGLDEVIVATHTPS